MKTKLSKIIDIAIGQENRKHEFDLKRKIVMLTFSLYTGILVLSYFTYSAFKSGQITNFFVNTALLVVLVLSTLLIRRFQIIAPLSRIILALLGIAMFFYFMSGGIEGTGALWVIIYPLYVFFLLGLIEGLIFSSALFFLMLLFLYSPLKSYLQVSYSDIYQIRMISIYTLTMLLSFFFEYIRRYIHDSIISKNNLLEAAIDRVNTQDEKIRTLAFYDNLTGLCNRNLLGENLKTALTRADREKLSVGLLFIDLDRFKFINDTLGHAAGDEMLREAAKRIKESVRISDIVSRLGGDEFVVLLPAITDPTHGALVASKIIARMQEPFLLENKPYQITCSIGVATYEGGKTEDKDLIKRADLAMYRAKELGKNTFMLFNQSMQHHVREIMEMERKLRTAIAEDKFILYYQPIVDIQTGFPVGAEALVRWLGANGEIIPPGAFIPIAEETGLIVDLGYSVMEKSLTFINNFKIKNEAFVLSVNIASKQLRDRRLALLIEKWQTEKQGKISSIEIEFTERLLVEDNPYTKEVLRDLSSLGMSFSIDDFGTGYSSMSYLYKFDINKIKIDRSFISGITENPKKQAIVKAMIAMAKSLDVTTVAEGVETEEEQKMLLNMGCDLAQGYFFSKPMTEEKFVKYYESFKNKF